MPTTAWCRWKAKPRKVIGRGCSRARSLFVVLRDGFGVEHDRCIGHNSAQCIARWVSRMDMTIREIFRKHLQERGAVVIDPSEFEKYRHPAEIDKRTIDIAAHILEDCGPVSACQYLHCLIADELKPIQLSKMIVCEALMSGIPYSDFLRQFGYVQTQGDV